jgi:hypothetical protein
MVTNAGQVSNMEVKVEFPIVNATIFATMIKDTHAVEKIQTLFGTYLPTTETKQTSLYAEPKSIIHRTAPRRVATTHVTCACNLATVRPSSMTKNHVVSSAYLTTQSKTMRIKLMNWDIITSALTNVPRIGTTNLLLWDALKTTSQIEN